MDNYKNYIELKNRIPFRRSFMYLDCDKYICDELFLDHELYGVRFFKKELRKEDSEFVLVMCSIFSKDIDKFEDCMEHLRRKLEFLDYDMVEYDLYSLIFSYAEYIHDIEEGNCE